MFLKDHIVRSENIKTIQMLNDAKVDHEVIALFMTTEGVSMQVEDVRSILNSYENLGSSKVPAKKAQALLAAKHVEQDDQSLPCPTCY